MATIIQIKRSSGTSKPSELAQGELAYAYGVGGSFGEQLFIGTGTETDGVAANIDVIGGKYFTDKLDHTVGTLTASSAILVDSNKAIDELIVGNSTTVGGTIKFKEGTNNGAHFVALKAPNSVSSDLTFTLPGSYGSNGQALVTDGSGNLSFTTLASTLTIVDDSSTSTTFNLATDSLKLAGGTGISTSISGDTVTITGDDATTSTKGIASFDGTDFSVSSGAVSLQTERIQDIAGAMFSSNTETLITATYQDADGTIDLVVDNNLANYDNSSAGFITGSSTTTLTNKTFDANGTGNSITNIEVADLASGVLDTDLSSVSASDDTLASAKAIKTYVDNSVSNLMTSWTIADDSSTTSTITQADTLRFLGGTGISSTVSGDQVTFAIDNTVATLTGSQTLTNKVIDTASNTITIVEADISDLGAYITASSSDTLTNKVINGSQLVDGSVANAKLTNSTITVAGDSGSNAVDLGDTLTIQGTANEIETSVSGDTITIGLPNDVTIGNNLTITGNLTVNGTTTTISTTNTVASDTLFELGNGTTGSPANDSGIIIERGDSDNAFIGFDESADKFIVGTTTATGASTGNLTITTGTLVANIEATTMTLGGSNVVSTDNSLELTNKTINGSSNTISNIGNSSLTNSIINFTTDSGNQDIDLGDTITVSGGEGIDTSQSGDTLTIAAELATTSNKGVASFSADNFTVTSGAVTVTTIDGGTYP